MLRFGIIVFPGTNCDMDTYHALKHFPNVMVERVWFDLPKRQSLHKFDALILPGGFSYGDILRAGALAKLTPIMKDLQIYAQSQRGLILGICNGFQILCEARLLPGTLVTNDSGKFVCRNQKIKVWDDQSPFTNQMKKGQILEMPVAHQQGKYLEAGPAFWTFSYESSPNGGLIAGVFSDDQRVMGMMPHPERNIRPGFGNGDGKLIFQSMINFLWKEKSR